MTTINTPPPKTQPPHNVTEVAAGLGLDLYEGGLNSYGSITFASLPSSVNKVGSTALQLLARVTLLLYNKLWVVLHYNISSGYIRIHQFRNFRLHV